MGFHFVSAFCLVLFAAAFLAECSVESAGLEQEIARSPRWDAYKERKRQRRNTDTMEWQEWHRFPTCTLSNLTTYDALGRRESGLLATPQCQGRCGSCWAFAATHVFTDYLSLQRGSRVAVLSQDHLTQCISPALGLSQGRGNGCCGGNADYAFRYMQMVGAVSQTCRPYTLQNYYFRGNEKDYYPLMCPQSCVNSSISFSPSSNRIPGFTYLTSESAVIAALNQGHPIYAAMEVRNDFLEYRCGVFCADPLVMLRALHAVEIVDYSSNFEGSPYWVVKNSWGTGWGESGYFRIARGRNQFLHFATITTTEQTSLPEVTADLAAFSCAPQEPDDASDNELILSAVEFAIERLNNRSLVQCTGDSSAVATLSLSSILNGTVQVVEGTVVQAMVEVNVDGCTEDTATITFIIMMDLADNFSLVEFGDYMATTSSDAQTSTRNLGCLGYVTLVISLLATFV